MGRQAVPRAQRRGPRRGDRGVGPEGLLRLGAADLDDPLHGRHGPVERSRRPVVRPRGPAARRRPRSRSITAESSAPGERHEELADHVGEIAVRAWRGFPADPETETSGVGWILAVDWVPYQRSTFVTPAFPGYVSGHSTFSRAAAEVMTAFTGDAYFPGGLERVHAAARRAAPRGGPDRGHHAAVGDVLRRRRPGRRVAASTWASTSPRTTSTAARSGRRAARRRGRSPSATSTARRADDFHGFVVVVYDLRVALIHGGSRQEMGEEPACTFVDRRRSR